MNLVSRKHADELMFAFRQDLTLPLGCKAPLPAEQVGEQIDTYTKLFDVYKTADNSQVDLDPTIGRIFMKSDLPPGDAKMQWVMDFRGDTRHGELSEVYERSGNNQYEDRSYVRYNPSRIDVLNLHVEDQGVVAHSLHLDRNEPANSTVLLYQWPDGTT